MATRADRRSRSSSPRLTRAILVVVGALVVTSGLAVPPAGADVTSVESSAFGVSITPPQAVDVALAPQPFVSYLDPPGPATIETASQAAAYSPSAGNSGALFRTLAMTVSTGPAGPPLGTHTAGTKSSADVGAAYWLQDVLTARQVHSECTATGEGSTGKATFGSLFIEQSDRTFKTFNNYEPAPNTTFTLHGADKVVFNEQISLDSGQTTGIIVNAIHIYDGGLDVYVGQSRCTATGPDVIVDPKHCDLGIVKEMSPTPLVSGQPVTITITITNHGVECLPALTLMEDGIPPGLTLGLPTVDDPQWLCGDDVCFSESAFPAGHTVHITITGTVVAAPGDHVKNCATVTNPADTVPLTDNNESCVETDVIEKAVCDLQIVKVMKPDPLVAGDPATIELTVTNLGSGPCQGAALQDNKVPGITFKQPTSNQFGWFCGIQSVGGAAMCSNFSTLPGHYSATITLPATVGFATTFVRNCASVTSPSDVNPSNNTGCDESVVEFLPICDLVVTKSMSPDPLLSGQPATITITLENRGSLPCTATKTKVVDKLPASLAPLSGLVGPTGWTCAGTICTGPGVIAPQTQVVFTMQVQVNAAPGGQVTNCATATGPTNDKKPGNNADCATLLVADPNPECDLEIVKTMRPNPLTKGGSATITVKVRNVGGAPCAATSANPTVMTDPHPVAGMTLSTVPSTLGWSCTNAGGVTCTRTTAIAQFQSFTFTFRGKVTGENGDIVENCARISNVNDVDPSNDVSCARARIGMLADPFCDLQVTKTMSPTPLKSDQQAIITITVKNVGNGPCFGTLTAPTRVVDTVTGVSLNPPTSNQSNWFCGLDDAVTAACFNPTDMVKGYTVKLTIRGTVTAPAGGTASNCVTVSNPHDVNPLNNTFCLGPLKVV